MEYANSWKTFVWKHTYNIYIYIYINILWIQQRSSRSNQAVPAAALAFAFGFTALGKWRFACRNSSLIFLLASSKPLVGETKSWSEANAPSTALFPSRSSFSHASNCWIKAFLMISDLSWKTGSCVIYPALFLTFAAIENELVGHPLFEYGNVNVCIYIYIYIYMYIHAYMYIVYAWTMVF